MISSIKAQAAMKVYRNVHAIERAKPVSSSELDTHAHNNNSNPSYRQKNFAQILKEQMQNK